MTKKNWLLLAEPNFTDLWIEFTIEWQEEWEQTSISISFSKRSLWFFSSSKDSTCQIVVVVYPH